MYHIHTETYTLTYLLLIKRTVCFNINNKMRSARFYFDNQANIHYTFFFLTGHKINLIKIF